MTACRRSLRGGRPTPGPIDPLPGARPGPLRAGRSVAGRRMGLAARRAATRRGRGGDRPGRSRLPLILVATLAMFLVGSLLLAGVAVVGTVAAVTVLSDGLPDPTNLGALTFAQPTIVYDRTGKIQLGRVPARAAPGRRVSTRSRSSSSTRRRPPRTGRSGRTAASTPPRSSARSPTTPPGTERPRGVDDHPAARPGAAPAGGRDRRRARTATSGRPRS